MTHFSESEIIDAVEGRLSPARQRHAATCTGCARQIEDLRGVLARASAAEVPEPSPLFWEHFSARVRDELASETPDPWKWTFSLRPLPIAAAAVAVVALLVTFAVFRSPSNKPVPVDMHEVADAGPTAVAPGDADADADADDVEIDEAWAVVRAVADDVVLDDVTEAGISARPGAAERAVRTLSPAERTELAAIIAEELKRSGA